MTDASAWAIAPLRKAHDRDAFACGNADLDRFFRQYARQSETLGIARTFVATRPGDPRVLGYYTVRNGQVEVQRLQPEDVKRFPRYPVPVVHLARLAVDRAAQGQRLGERLLVDALARAYAASREVGAYAVEVVAIDADAKRFYVKYGFRELLDDSLHLYLPMATVARLVGDG